MSNCLKHRHRNTEEDTAAQRSHHASQINNSRHVYLHIAKGHLCIIPPAPFVYRTNTTLHLQHFSCVDAATLYLLRWFSPKAVHLNNAHLDMCLSAFEWLNNEIKTLNVCSSALAWLIIVIIRTEINCELSLRFDNSVVGKLLLWRPLKTLRMPVCQS